jgi:hypothetical protein
MPPLANWPLNVIREELERVGVHLLQDFGDGQTLWGDEPLGPAPYPGSSCMASEYIQGRYDIYTVRAILTRVDRAGHAPLVEQRLHERINEGVE